MDKLILGGFWVDRVEISLHFAFSGLRKGSEVCFSYWFVLPSNGPLKNGLLGWRKSILDANSSIEIFVGWNAAFN